MIGLFLFSIAFVGLQADKLGSLDVICGAHSLYIGLGIAGVSVGTFEEFQRKIGPPSPRGYSMLDLEEAGRGAGANSASIRARVKDLESLGPEIVVIARMSSAHYVVILKIDSESVVVADPPNETTMARSLFEHAWPGDAILLSKGSIPEFPPKEALRKNIWAYILVCMAGSGVGAALWYDRRRRRA